ncbi:tRNA adenosine(34) deaminase TadA [bacterium]|nr:tRNA adenosine(34) deaminase TadA [bacterium]MCI0602998.1 tRNA adenosine(34) deaminase TadA [bacterium]
MVDEEYMAMALEEARLAAAENEVPVGAVLVFEDRIIARNHNRMVQQKDPLAHAELLTMQAALKTHPVKWLLNTSLYVTLEPCVMCAGALVLARVKRLVIATPDPKAGACGSILDVVRWPQLNHRVEVSTGLLQNEASTLLKEFFQKLRLNNEKGLT